MQASLSDYIQAAVELQWAHYLTRERRRLLTDLFCSVSIIEQPDTFVLLMLNMQPQQYISFISG